MRLPLHLCRLDTTNELSMAIDRAADQRAAFIKQRWQAGPLKSIGRGTCQGKNGQALLGSVIKARNAGFLRLLLVTQCISCWE